MTARFLGLAVLAASLAIATPSVLGIDSSAAQEKSGESKPWPSRTSDGQPDMQGVWGSADTGMYSLRIEPQAHLETQGLPKRGLSGQSPSGGSVRPSGKPTIVIDPPTGILPYQPWALERRNSVLREFVRPKPWQVDPQTRSWPNGVPRENYYSTIDGSIGGPIQILQPPGYVVFLYETHHEFRVVPLDGRPHSSKDIKLWMGSSRGRWEGNTLVIDVVHQNDSTRFDVMGNFHSDQMRVTERWNFVDKDTIEYQATIDDPKVYTKPWTLAVKHIRAPAGTELMEYAGVEGETGAELASELTGEGGSKK